MAESNVLGLETLEAWKKSKDFAVMAYKKVLPLLPLEEKWGLNQQIRRAAQSIPANIAEGHGRFYYQDNVRFCYIARGSLIETYNHIKLAEELGFIPVDVLKEIKNQVEELTRILKRYIAYLKTSKRGSGEPGADYRVREESSKYSIDDMEEFTSIIT